jgi:alginate O-acetyltransferase complex protein AlgI
MIFSSTNFIYVFLPIALFIYYITPRKFKNLAIMLESYFFYSWGEPRFLLVIIAAAMIDYVNGRLMGKFRENPNIMKILLISTVILNVGLLAVFKYSSFFIHILNSITGLQVPDPKIPLPIGLSFITFQSMSYTLDLYAGRIPVQKNIITFGAYTSLFPQMIAGPIVRYSDVQKELDYRTITIENIGEGAGLFIKGLAKKVLLANNIGALWNSIKGTPLHELSVLTSWLGILAFTFQILFDFSGYTDMARGLGRMLGFTFPENFNYPYMSKSITEFWRRWHMTLGGWFRSYLYIPLGGNREGWVKQIRNLLIVWLLTGLWHGASWNFVLWGLYFGVLIICEKFFLSALLERLPKILQIAYAFLLIVFGWVLFDFNTLPMVGGYLGSMFGGGTGLLFDKQFLYLLYNNAIIFVFCALFSTNYPAKLYEYAKIKTGKLMDYLVPVSQGITLIVCTIYLVDATYNPFLYFRF